MVMLYVCMCVYVYFEVGNGNSLQYSCLDNPWTEEPGGLQSMGSQKSQTRLIMHAHAHMYVHEYTYKTLSLLKFRSIVHYYLIMYAYFC